MSIKRIICGVREPFFDSLDGDLAKAPTYDPSVKGDEFGDCFELAQLNGSEANDSLESTEK